MRIPPHSVEAEQSVLGSILLDKEAMISVSETLVPEDFYKEAHKVIYESMLKLYNSQSEIDLITLTDELRDQGYLDDIGGIAYITSLSTVVPTTSNIKYYVNIVKENAINLLGKDNVVFRKHPSLGAEDFSFFLEHSKGAFYHLGCRNQEKNILSPLHTADFDIDEDCLEIGVMLHVLNTLSFAKL